MKPLARPLSSSCDRRRARLPWWSVLVLAAACTGHVDGEGDSSGALAVHPLAACGAALPITAVAVSGAQTGNPGTNAIDGNLATRWSQNELGATLVGNFSNNVFDDDGSPVTIQNGN